MFPDFAGMARVRLAGVRDPTLAAGIAYHHRCDAAFHRHPTFLAQCSEAVARLTADGVARGPARAVAHVGSLV